MQVQFRTGANLVQTLNWTGSSVQVQQLHGTKPQVQFAVLATVEFIAELHLNTVQTTGTVHYFSLQKPYRSSLLNLQTNLDQEKPGRSSLLDCEQIWNKKSVAGQVCWTCKQIRTKKSLAGQVGWTCKQIWKSQLWFDPLCDCDMTCTHTQSHRYKFLPGQNICTHTCTLQKTCPLPTGLPLPVQYTNGEYPGLSLWTPSRLLVDSMYVHSLSTTGSILASILVCLPFTLENSCSWACDLTRVVKLLVFHFLRFCNPKPILQLFWSILPKFLKQLWEPLISFPFHHHDHHMECTYHRAKVCLVGWYLPPSQKPWLECPGKSLPYNLPWFPSVQDSISSLGTPHFAQKLLDWDGMNIMQRKCPSCLLMLMFTWFCWMQV